ncbi:MAG: hypothetical protein KKH72_14630 [Alphaproteobacteria bacterium]|nr:hypothetical protein [Alphaproteobacteria bacterium]
MIDPFIPRRGLSTACPQRDCRAASDEIDMPAMLADQVTSRFDRIKAQT